MPNSEPIKKTQAPAPAASTAPELVRDPEPLARPTEVLLLQRHAGNQAVERWLHAGQGYAPETVAPVMIQTKPVAGRSDSATEHTQEREPARATSALIVDDDAETIGPGQMRKSDFLRDLKASVCTTAEDALRGTIWSAMGCPYIERWFSHYHQQSSQHIERALHRYAPETASARTARDYIPLITQRLRRGISEWARTGEVSGVPPELARQGMPGATLQGLVGASLSALGGAVSGLVSGAGRALSRVGRALFKARAGGAHEAGDPHALQAQLGEGHALEGSVRARMEGAFGQSFAQVRLHTDAHAAQVSGGLNARAFTVGRHVAFGAGEYQPGTLIGDALLAHELAHVAQQGSGARVSGPLHKGSGAYTALEEDADVAAVGAVAALWGGAQGRLSDIGHQALPRLRSGLQLQRCGHQKAATQKGAEVPKAQTKLSAREAREVTVKEAGERLREVNLWASTQVKAQNVPSMTGVTTLDSKQSDNVAKSIELLTQAESQFGTKQIESLPAQLDKIVSEAKEARKYSGSSDDLHIMQSRAALSRAIVAASDTEETVQALSERLDVSAVAKNVDTILTTLQKIKDGQQDMYDGVDAVAKLVKEAKEKISELRARYAKTPKAIGRIIFVLKNFLALNAPGRASTPTAEDIKTYQGTLHGGLSDDFNTVFGEGLMVSRFDVFVAYADVLEQQLVVREKMAAAGVKAHSPIPNQGDAESYFKALKSKPNSEVFPAYQTYAQAYFYHRVVDKFDDMHVKGVEDLFQRPLSIFGTRPLVCTGYSLLGSHLLKFAGAKLKTFIVAVRATDEDLASGKIDSGHAIAAMSRKGSDFFVSNYLIVDSKKAGIGPDAVAWEKSHAPLYEASGATIPAANAALGDKLARLIPQAEQRLKSKK